jgi:hypothetical protein
MLSIAGITTTSPSFFCYADVIMQCNCAECHQTEHLWDYCYCGECRYAECRYAECRYAECGYAEFHYAVRL